MDALTHIRGDAWKLQNACIYLHGGRAGKLLSHAHLCGICIQSEIQYG